METAAQLPEYNPDEPWDYEYGDAIAIGPEDPYDEEGHAVPYELYIWTRPFVDQGQVNPQWFNVGPFPGPSYEIGPMGPEGKQGEQGQRGSRWQSSTKEPDNDVPRLQYDQALVVDEPIEGSTIGNVYQYDGKEWQLIGNIRGPQGIQGIRGLTGPQGIQGPVGPAGPRGPEGQFIQIKGELASTAQLPNPDEVSRSTAYLIPEDGANHIWLIGEDENGLKWIDAGSFSATSKIIASQETINEFDATYINNSSDVKYSGARITEDAGSISLSASESFTNQGDVEVTKTIVMPLPIEASEMVTPKVVEGVLQFDLTEDTKSKINNSLQKGGAPNNIYATNSSGQFTYVSYGQSSVGNYIVQRKSDGNITVPTAPSAAGDAVSKKYVDDTEDVLQGQIDTLDTAMKTYMPKAGGMFTGSITAPGIAFSPTKSVITNPAYVVAQTSQSSEMAPVSIANLKSTLGVPSSYVSSFNGSTGAVQQHLYRHNLYITGYNSSNSPFSMYLTIYNSDSTNLSDTHGSSSTTSTKLDRLFNYVFDNGNSDSVSVTGHYKTSAGNFIPLFTLVCMARYTYRIYYVNSSFNEGYITLDSSTPYLLIVDDTKQIF